MAEMVLRVVAEDNPKMAALYVEITDETPQDQALTERFENLMRGRVMIVDDPPWQCAGVRETPSRHVPILPVQEG